VSADDQSRVQRQTSIALIEAFVKADKPVGAVCHAPAALVNVRGKDGEYLVKAARDRVHE